MQNALTPLALPPRGGHRINNLQQAVTALTGQGVPPPVAHAAIHNWFANTATNRLTTCEGRTLSYTLRGLVAFYNNNAVADQYITFDGTTVYIDGDPYAVA